MYHTRRARAVPALLHCSAPLHYTQRTNLFTLVVNSKVAPVNDGYDSLASTLRTHALVASNRQRRLRERVVPVVPESKAADACADSQMHR